MDIITRIAGEDKYNYLRAKGMAAVGKVALIQKRTAEAEDLFKKAQWEVTAEYTDMHPLGAKFNQYLVETYNQKGEGPEISKILNDLTEANLSILQSNYGEKSIYNVRSMYTLFTARLHQQTTTGSDKVMSQLASLTHEGQEVKANQFLFKAILIDIMMMMGSAGNQQVARMIEVKLAQVFEAQLNYCDGNKNHPFLEEVVSVFASFFESNASYSNALLMWSKLLRVQQEMFGEDRIQMVSTYKKIASLSLNIGQPQSSIKYYKII